MTSLYRDATDVRLVFHVILGHDAVAAHVGFVALRERFVNDALNRIENRPGATRINNARNDTQTARKACIDSVVSYPATLFCRR